MKPIKEVKKKNDSIADFEMICVPLEQIDASAEAQKEVTQKKCQKGKIPERLKLVIQSQQFKFGILNRIEWKVTKT